MKPSYIFDQGSIVRHDFWEGIILVHTLWNKRKQAHVSTQWIFNIFINSVLLQSPFRLLWHKTMK